MRQDQLGEQLDISKPAVSRALDSLESKGYIIRRQDPEDRRIHRVLLTDQARVIGPDIVQVYNHIYSAATLGISQEELSEFIHLFSHMSQNFTRSQALTNQKLNDA